MIDGDSYDYHVIEKSVEFIKNVPGLTCEIGLRTGGGTQLIIDTIQRTHPNIRTHIAIDPYGSLPYIDDLSGNDKWVEQGPYSNEMFREAMVDLYSYCKDKQNVNFYFYPLEDTEFFKRFADGVPVYLGGQKEIVNQYAFVVFDGPHTAEAVMEETKFFSKRAAPNALFVFDDTILDPNEAYYDHTIVHQFLTNNGWIELDNLSKKKRSYQNINMKL